MPVIAASSSEHSLPRFSVCGHIKNALIFLIVLKERLNRHPQAAFATHKHSESHKPFCSSFVQKNLRLFKKSMSISSPAAC